MEINSYQFAAEATFGGDRKLYLSPPDGSLIGDRIIVSERCASGHIIHHHGRETTPRNSII